MIPSTVSSIGKTWILVKFGMSGQGCTDTISPSLTLKFVLTTLLILIFPFSSLGSTKAIHTVYFLFLPFSITGSPLNNFNSYSFAGESYIVELSSFIASSTCSRFKQ